MTQAQRTIVFTGGGSAGHVVPSLPLIERLVARGWRVHYVGSTSGLEQRLIADCHISFDAIATGKLRRYWSFENALDLFRVAAGCVQALIVLRRRRPHVVFSKGGYVSFPVVVAAWLLRIPVIAHESDLTPGLANRLAFPLVANICVNFAETHIGGYSDKIVHSGTPIRPALLQGSAERGRTFCSVEPERPVLLVVGGSLGSERINQVVRQALPELTAQFHVIHICGAGNLDAALDRHAHYSQFEFVSEQWGDILAAAALVVSRAGANTLFELLTLGKPNLLIPLSLGASRGDQIDNARYAQAHGFSAVLKEEQLSAETLLARLNSMCAELDQWPDRLQRFPRMDSVACITALIEQRARP
jgi:UDP-N-acetylglucosamine--N-acetylmuramyl-(pentapeptide) pyrophosphoryl-undecaprenol N-acetylglucosamine transferase